MRLFLEKFAKIDVTRDRVAGVGDMSQVTSVTRVSLKEKNKNENKKINKRICKNHRNPWN
jgi:hypothetical protein